MRAALDAPIAARADDHPVHFLDATRALGAAYLVTMMLSMGIELGGAPPEDQQTRRRQRRLILRGLAFNLILLPLAALTLTRAFGTRDEVAIAFLVLAASPGGRFAPHLAKIAGGDLGLSVEITLFVVKLVCFTAPVTVRWMLHLHHVEIHELTFVVQLLVLQLLPYLAGKSLRKRRPELATRMERPLHFGTWICAGGVLALVLLGHDLRGVLALAGERGWWPVLLFAPLTLSLGWLLGGPTEKTRRSLALSAPARNLALALVLASTAFPDRHVQLATFAIWTVYVTVGYAFAWLVGSSIRRPASYEPA